MTIAHASEHPPSNYRERQDARLPLEFPSEEPFEDKVAETKRHLEARTLLYLIVNDNFADMTVGSDQFVYFDAEDPTRCLAPDVFVKDDVRVVDFDSWKVWERGTPHLAVEIVSAADRLKLTWAEKFERYEALGIRELVRFDPHAVEPITVWDRVGDGLVKRVVGTGGVYACKTLGAYWAVETSADFGKQLRLSWERAKSALLPTPSEKVLHLAQELADERHARTLAEHARLVAEQKQRDEANACALAEAAHAAALGEIQRLRAELERVRASVE